MRNNLQCSLPSSHRSPQTGSDSNSPLWSFLPTTPDSLLQGKLTELSELFAGRTSRLRRSTKGWPMSFSRISPESQKRLASHSGSYIESTVSGRSHFNTTSSLDAAQLMVPTGEEHLELYSDQPSDRHSSKENSVTRSSGDR